jgi:hypothetical protein
LSGDFDCLSRVSAGRTLLKPVPSGSSQLEYFSV